jgi:hypothetical protein
MSKVLAGVEYLAAGLVGLVIAFVLTGCVSYAIFPSNGPVGEGFAMMLIYFIFLCACVPGFATLMRLHRQGRKDTRGLIACEIILRSSFLVAACFVCFMGIKLPISIWTKGVACCVAAAFGVWAIKPIPTPEKSGFRQVRVGPPKAAGVTNSVPLRLSLTQDFASFPFRIRTTVICF